MKGDVIVAVINRFLKNVATRVNAGAGPVSAMMEEHESVIVRQHQMNPFFTYYTTDDLPKRGIKMKPEQLPMFSRYDDAPKKPAKQPFADYAQQERTKSREQRERERKREVEAITDYHAEANEIRVRRAREIAESIARVRGEVMVWQVADYWRDHVEPELSWRDSKGKTYWAGAIFRDRKKWECVGMGPSPYNHNTSNGRWRLK